MFDTSKIYNAGLAAFNVASFTVDEAFPAKGHLRFIVPDIYTDNGDNEYKNDDYIDLDFEVEEGGIDIPDDPQQEQYGDMNLGFSASGLQSAILSIRSSIGRLEQLKYSLTSIMVSFAASGFTVE